MLTEKEYRTIFDRICRQHTYCTDCEIYTVCQGKYVSVTNAFQFLNALEEWAEGHPIVTNRDKYAEVFGYKFKKQTLFDKKCSSDYTECIRNGKTPCQYCAWWDEEYEDSKELCYLQF